MANLGLIVGRVYSPGGGFKAKDVRVVMTALTGHDGKAIGYGGGSSPRYVEDVTDDKGRFAIRFNWSGADIGSAVLTAQATLVALNDDKDGTTVSSVKPTFVRLALIKDVATLMSTAGSTFNSVPECLDFAVDLWSSLRDVSIYPAWKTVQLWSTECWALCGGRELTLGT